MRDGAAPRFRPESCCAPMGNRCGPAVGTLVAPSTGTAERDAAAALVTGTEAAAADHAGRRQG